MNATRGSFGGRWAALLSLLPALPWCLAAEPPIEQVVGGIEAIVFVCGPIDAKSAKTGQELLQKTSAQRKLDLPTIRKSDGYKSIYNSEVNRMLALPQAERAAACRNAW